MEMVKVRFKGAHNKLCMMPGYSGKVEPEKEYPTTKENYEKELKTRTDWELVVVSDKIKKDKVIKKNEVF